MSKRTLDTFFKPITPPPKKHKSAITSTPTQSPTTTSANHPPDEYPKEPDTHSSYPMPIAKLPVHLSTVLKTTLPARQPKEVTNQAHLDLLHFQPYIPTATANSLFTFLRNELPFYRVQYTIRRGGVSTQINTPRFTTVFGVDETARFIPRSEIESTSTPPSTQNQTPPPPSTKDLILTSTSATPNPQKYTHDPRPIPTCLAHLLSAVQSATGARYNFVLVNYYASGEDSISFHSDDERFLGPEPTIASLSLGGEREFVMKHKPFATTPQSQPRGIQGQTKTGGKRAPVNTVPVKMPLRSGDMVVMRGQTQSNWLHSIPKRRGKSGESIKGRINITFRRAMVPGGTDNYYTYNVGEGELYRWDLEREEMVSQESGEQ